MTAVLHDLEVQRPETVAQALRVLRMGQEEGQPWRPMAGCTDVLVEAHFGKPMAPRWLDVTGLRADLGGHAWRSDGLWLSALTTYTEALDDPEVRRRAPMLAHAASLVGATQIQTRGTFVGNVENGSPAADAVPALLALDAVVVLGDADGQRRVPLAEYYTGYRRTQRRPDELVLGLEVPTSALDRAGAWYRKVGTRAYQAITKVGLAAVFEWRGGRLHDPRVVAVAMAPSIVRCRHLEAELAGKTAAELDPVRLRAAQARDLQPIDDIRSNSRYRAEVFARLLAQGLRETAEAV
jgi:CO/xanthine dehydrogenase FAD-binding subunit